MRSGGTLATPAPFFFPFVFASPPLPLSFSFPLDAVVFALEGAARVATARRPRPPPSRDELGAHAAHLVAIVPARIVVVARARVDVPPERVPTSARSDVRAPRVGATRGNLRRRLIILFLRDGREMSNFARFCRDRGESSLTN